jgi:hypothetical protein
VAGDVTPEEWLMEEYQRTAQWVTLGGDLETVYSQPMIQLVIVPVMLGVNEKNEIMLGLEGAARWPKPFLFQEVGAADDE